jgi:U3 small nucleolar RNA-associated protein 12
VVVITCGGEGEAKAWTIDNDLLAGKITSVDSTGGPLRAIKPLVDGLLPLASISHAQRIAQVEFHPTEQLLAFQTTEKTVEILRLRTAEEIRKKAARRKKREREKKKGKQVDGEQDEEMPESANQPLWKDRLASWITIRALGKIRSFDFGIGAGKLKTETTVMLALSNNSLEVYQLPPQPTKSKKTASGESEGGEAEKLYSVELPGHRTDIRTLSVSSDDALLASGSNGMLKIWNIKTTKCLRTLECGYAICSAFLPGDRHIVVGTKAGELQLFDVGNSTLLETFSAHTSTVWGISLRADGKGLVSGSADKDIKFWDFEIKDTVINPEETDAPKVRRDCALS